MAAYPPFKRQGEGSSPSGPIVGTKVLAAACLALNQFGDGSSPSGPTDCTRDVTAACLLAMQDVRVQLPLGALAQDVGKPGNPPVRELEDRRSRVGSTPTFLTDLFAVWPNGKAAPC